MINIAMLSKWHVHAEGMAKDLIKLGQNITCVWDEDPERGKAWADELGVDFEPDLYKCVNRKDVDAVVCYTPTTMHKEVLIAAANAGKHIFTEKALATTVTECEEIAEAVKNAGVKFLISMPQRTDSVVLYTKQLLDSGKLGTVSLIRIRNGHNGSSGNWLPEYWYDEKDTGGGAMMDLGCHPMYTLSYLLGKPRRITSMFKSYCDKPVDDSAISVIEFANGTMGMSETSFVVHNAPSAFEVYGTDGTLLVQDGKVKLCMKSLGDVTNKFVEVTTLPEKLAPPIELFIDAIENDTETEFGLDEAIALTELLENAYKSHKENTIIDIK
jgi:predicted dehydrogenase